MGGVGFDKTVSILQNELLDFAKSKSTVSQEKQADKDAALSGLSGALKDGLLTTDEFKAIENKLTQMLKAGGNNSQDLASQVQNAMFAVLGESTRKMVTGNPKDLFTPSAPSTIGSNGEIKKDSMDKVVQFNVSNQGDRLRVSTTLKDSNNIITVTHNAEAGLSGVGTGTTIGIGDFVVLEGIIGTDGKIQTGAKFGPIDLKAGADTKTDQTGAQIGIGPVSTGITNSKEKVNWKTTFTQDFHAFPLTTSVSAGVDFPNGNATATSTSSTVITKTVPRANASATVGTNILKDKGINLGITGDVGNNNGLAEGRVYGMLTFTPDSIINHNK